MGQDKYVISVDQWLDAEPAAIFALLSDPSRHQEIDGSGTVQEVRTSQLPLQVGSHFDMHMDRGIQYSTRNTVTALDLDRLITWRTRPLVFPMSFLIGGRTWTYALTPESGGTRVTETWDLRPERNRRIVRPRAGDPAADMSATLTRIGEVLSATRTRPVRPTPPPPLSPGALVRARVANGARGPRTYGVSPRRPAG